MCKPNGYWRDFANFERELRAFVQEHGLEEGRIPSTAQIKAAGRQDLITGFKAHGSVREVAAKLGWQVYQTAKPSGYWQDFTNLSRELQAFIEEHGLSANTLPATTQLRASGRHDLVHAIEEYWSMREVATKLGWPMSNTDKPLGYWNNIANLEEELLSHIAAHGKKGAIPAYMELEKAGRMDLIRAIEKHGGWAEVAKRLGLKRKIQVDPYWQDFTNLKRELREFVRAQHLPKKQLPARWQLRAAGREDLLRAIDYHRTARSVAAKLGWQFVSTVKADGYWEEFANLARDILAFIAVHGQAGMMPPTTLLQAMGRHDLIKAIAKHGGSAAVATRLELSRSQTKATQAVPSWPTFVDFKREVQAFIAAHGQAGVMPTTGQFQVMGRQDLVLAIDEYGGSATVALLIGLALRNPTPVAWQDFADLKRELILFVDEHGLPIWRMPSDEQLQAAARQDLIDAIVYHGSAQQVAKRLGWQLAQKPAHQNRRAK